MVPLVNHFFSQRKHVCIECSLKTASPHLWHCVVNFFKIFLFSVFDLLLEYSLDTIYIFFLPSIVFEHWNTSLFLIISFSCIKNEIFLKITEFNPFLGRLIICGVTNDLASWNPQSKLFFFLESKPFFMAWTRQAFTRMMSSKYANETIVHRRDFFLIL